MAFEVPDWRTKLAKEIIDGYEKHPDTNRRGIEEEVRRICNPLRTGDVSDDSSHYVMEDDMFDVTVREAKMVEINGIMSLMFPHTDKWFSNRYIPQGQVEDATAEKAKRALEKATDMQFRQLAQDNFYSAMTEALHDYLDFGTTNIRMTKGRRRFANFRAIDKGRYRFQLDDEGFEEIMWYKDRMSVLEISTQFGTKALPQKINEAYENQKYEQRFDVYHRVSRRDLFKKGRQANPENREYESIWVSGEDKDVIGNSSVPRRKTIWKDGLYSMPYTIGRLMTRAGQDHGEGITTMILPMIRTANQKAVNIARMENFAGDPVWYQDDNNPLDDILPGSKVSVDTFGTFKPEVVDMRLGTVDIEKMGLEKLQNSIRSMYSNDMFKIFTNMEVATNRKTAFEARLMKSEQQRLLSTLLFNLVEEIVKPLLEKHFNMMVRERKFPDDLIRDIPAEYEIQLTTQLAKSIETTRVEDFMSFIEICGMVEQNVPGVTNSTINLPKSLRNIGLNMEIPVEELYTEEESSDRLKDFQNRQRQMEMAAMANQAAGIAGQLEQ